MNIIKILEKIMTFEYLLLCEKRKNEEKKFMEIMEILDECEPKLYSNIRFF